MTRVLLAEDHHLVRKALGYLLRDEPGLQVVGEASDGWEAVKLAKTLKPDVLLLDLSLPKLHGLEVLEHLKGQPRLQVLVVSMHSCESYVIEALRNGAAGYLLKDAPPADLIKAIKNVAQGGRFLSPELRTVAFGLKGSTTGSELTPRESLVLKLAAEGLSSVQIGKRLFISRRTAESHRANLMKKLGLKNQTDLVRFAIRTGLIHI